MAKARNTKKREHLPQLAQELEQHLAAIRQQIRRPAEAEFAKGNLTGPQRNVMQAIFHSSGCSLKELSAKVGLAHSTVSGIVDRLVKGGMLERQADAEDRRHTRITVSHEVRDFMEKRYPILAASPLLNVLRQATEPDRKAVVRGIRTLRRLLDSGALAPRSGV
ncbi:MAG TPA: MarR family transcriptional regulator [Terriglobales bacterium]|nr:MarR family transcriptional regulator [Terriglobales bacterium]